VNVRRPGNSFGGWTLSSATYLANSTWTPSIQRPFVHANYLAECQTSGQVWRIQGVRLPKWENEFIKLMTCNQWQRGFCQSSGQILFDFDTIPGSTNAHNPAQFAPCYNVQLNGILTIKRVELKKKKNNFMSQNANAIQSLLFRQQFYCCHANYLASKQERS
jgi:hypothetical protein